MPSSSSKAVAAVAAAAIAATVTIVVVVLMSPAGSSATPKTDQTPATSSSTTTATPATTAAPVTTTALTAATDPSVASQTAVPPGESPVPPEAPAPATTPAAPPSGLAATGPVLASGSEGAEVALLQLVLGQRGYWVSEQLGRFGQGTRHALVAFQKYSGLERTGRLDFWTRIALSGPMERAAPLRPGTGHRIDVDLARQVMVIATDDTVDGVFDISSGKRSTPTPKGTYRLEREIRGRRVAKLGVLISPKYFTGGYAIHGSPSVPAHAASHGCVRVTNQTIAYLWESGLIPLGTPITIG